MTLPAIEVLGFLAGLLLGSFLNVCIARVPRGESVVRPGSRCLACGRPIRWFDNIPILSWLLLRGRCRDCATAISWRYPAVELACAIWFGLAAARLWFCRVVPGSIATSIRAVRPWDQAIVLGIGVVGFACLGWLLIGLIAIDWRWQRLPDAFTLSGIAAGLFLVCVQAVFLGPTDDQIVLNSAKQLRLSSPGSFASRGNVFLTGPENLIFGRIVAVCAAALLLLGVRWAYKAVRGREGLGLGDIKMLAMVAAFLGFWPAVLTLFAGTILASCWAVALLARGKAGSETRLPFGSFLGVAGLFAALFGGGVIAWYSALLGL